MADELPKEQTKEINGVTLTNLEISKIAMICDYLVLDRFNDISSFFRFEKCFGPLLSKEDPNLLIEAFKEICGPKKKYITFGRLISAYIKWKTNSSQNESFNKFMKLVFNDMIKTENEVIGKLEEGTRIFSTKNTRGRKIISKFGVFTDSSKNCIQGFNIQYDDVFDSLLCTKKKEDQDKDITLEMNFHPNGRTILDRDGISHIAGKFSVKNKVIKFLIFKCRSGKTFCIGDNTEENDEQIELFIFGTSSCQLKTLRIETINDKLAYLEPKFQPSMRVNQKIIPFEEIDEKFINENIVNSQLIFEENEIKDVPIENLDEKTLLIPCINDDAFINDKESLKETLFGKDFNEVYKFYLQREQQSGEQMEDEKLKNDILAQTVRRIGLLKCYAKKFKIRENIDVLKNENKEEEERINMDKHLAKIKRFKRKINKKKEDLKISKRENLDDYEQEEDWPEEEKKEEGKAEEIKEEGKVEEIKEEGKVEEIKEEGKVEEIKEEEKAEEIKEEGDKIEIKIDAPTLEEEKIEIKMEENKKDEEIILQDSENIKNDSNNLEEVKLEENNEGKDNKIRLRGNRPKKLLNKSKIKKEENEEEKKEVVEEKKEVVEEIKEVVEEIKEAPKEIENIEEKKENIEAKLEEVEEIKEEVDNKNEILEEKNNIEEKKEEKPEVKKEEEKKVEEKKEEEKKEEEKKVEEKINLKDKEGKNEITENKKEDDVNLNNYEDNKLKDDNKEEIKEVKNDDEKNNKSKCSNCVLF